MIRLTQYDSGLPVYVDPQTVRLVQELPAKVYDLSCGEHVENGQRTRIDTTTQTLIVMESAKAVIWACGFKVTDVSVPQPSGNPG